MKKFKGFTLIELIVVIAIIGVLAAILVPAMMGWVRKASVNSANANAKSVFTNAQTIAQEMETQGTAIAGAAASGSYTKTRTSGDAFTDAVDRNISIDANAVWAVKIENNVIKSAIFAANSTTYLGAYPRQVNAASETVTKWAAGNVGANLNTAESGNWPS